MPFYFIAQRKKDGGLMAWIRVDDTLPIHKKTFALAKRLGMSRPHVSGHLLYLWLFAIRAAWEDADLSNCGDEGIERAAEWEGIPGTFAKALRESGFMDGFVLHNWLRYAGILVKDRLRKNRIKDMDSKSIGKKNGKNLETSGNKSGNHGMEKTWKKYGNGLEPVTSRYVSSRTVTSFQTEKTKQCRGMGSSVGKNGTAEKNIAVFGRKA